MAWYFADLLRFWHLIQPGLFRRSGGKWCQKHMTDTPLNKKATLQGINISYLGKRKIIFKMPFLGDMLIPWRVFQKESHLPNIIIASVLGVPMKCQRCKRPRITQCLLLYWRQQFLVASVHLEKLAHPQWILETFLPRGWKNTFKNLPPPHLPHTKKNHEQPAVLQKKSCASILSFFFFGGGGRENYPPKQKIQSRKKKKKTNGDENAWTNDLVKVHLQGSWPWEAKSGLKIYSYEL